MPVLALTPPEQMTDAHARPYFSWDDELTVDELRLRLNDPDPEIRGYFLGKLMRQAKPDDVFAFVTLDFVRSHRQLAERHLGRSADFWRWLLDRWETAPAAR